MYCALHTADATWTLPIPLTLVLILCALVYVRGWFRLRGSVPNAIPLWRLSLFMSGLLLLWISAGSPLMMRDHDLLTIHMIQHLQIMGVASPLILLGAPTLPFLNGIPRRFVRATRSRIWHWPPLAQLGHVLTHPAFTWLAAMAVLIGWHVPAVFGLAFRSHLWHLVEHASFIVTGLLFWWPVVQPWPSVALWPRWRIPLYLFMATLPCDILSAFLAFCGRVVYPFYLATPGRFNMSPLQDQECAGALMWFCSTFIYMIPAVIITIQILSPARTAPTDQAHVALGGLVGRPASADLEVV